MSATHCADFLFRRLTGSRKGLQTHDSPVVSNNGAGIKLNLTYLDEKEYSQARLTRCMRLCHIILIILSTKAQIRHDSSLVSDKLMHLRINGVRGGINSFL